MKWVGPRCRMCRRSVAGRVAALHLYNLPDDTEVWLCGRPACDEAYENEGASSPQGEDEEMARELTQEQRDRKNAKDRERRARAKAGTGTVEAAVAAEDPEPKTTTEVAEVPASEDTVTVEAAVAAEEVTAVATQAKKAPKAKKAGSGLLYFVQTKEAYNQRGPVVEKAAKEAKAKLPAKGPGYWDAVKEWGFKNGYPWPTKIRSKATVTKDGKPLK